MNTEEKIRKLEENLFELKKQIRMAKKSEKTFKTAINDQKEMIVRFNADGNITLANDAYCKYFNKFRKDLIDQNYLPHIPHEDIIKIKKFSNSLSYLNDTATIEHRVILPDNSIRWTKWIHQAFFNNFHAHVDTQAIGIDITEQRVMQNELRKKDLQLKAIYDNAGVGICLLSPDGSILNANKKIQEMFEYSDNNIMKLNCSDFLKDDFKPIHESYFNQITSKQVFSFQTDLMYKSMSGKVFWCELTVSPILKDDSSIESIIYILNNIEERKKTEEHQKEIIQKTSSAKEKAEYENNAKAEFIAQMSHEIRTPMNAIINMTDAALGTKLTFVQRDCLQTVKDSSEQLLILINGASCKMQWAHLLITF
jgi:PAS domain S-box-containing protein